MTQNELPNVCVVCDHYWDTPQHYYGCPAAVDELTRLTEELGLYADSPRGDGMSKGRPLALVPGPTQRCLIHDTTFEYRCGGCEADRKAASA